MSISRMLQQAAGAGGAGPFSRLYFSTNSDIRVLDVSDPENLSQIIDFNDSTNLDNAEAFAISSDGQTLFAACDNRFSSFDISDLSNITLLDTVVQSTFYAALYTAVLSADDNYLYTAGTQYDAIFKIDVSDPTNMSKVDQFQSATYADNIRSIAYHDASGTLFAASGTDHMVSSFDTSLNRLDTEQDYSLFGSSNAIFLDEENEYIYLTGYNDDAFVVLNAALDGSGALSTEGTFQNANIDGPLTPGFDPVRRAAFVPTAGGTNGSSKIVVLDVSDPTNISEISTFFDPNDTASEYAYRRVLYDPESEILWATYSDTAVSPPHVIAAIDASDLSSLTIISRYSTGSTVKLNSMVGV